MSVKLLTEHHLEFLSSKRGCTGLSESTLVKMPHCWESHVTAHMFNLTGREIVTILHSKIFRIWTGVLHFCVNNDDYGLFVYPVQAFTGCLCDIKHRFRYIKFLSVKL